MFPIKETPNPFRTWLDGQALVLHFFWHIHLNFKRESELFAILNPYLFIVS